MRASLRAPQSEHPRYATVAEAAEYGAMNQHTIRRMIDGGILTRYSYGTRILRVDLNELDALLRAGGR